MDGDCKRNDRLLKTIKEYGEINGTHTDVACTEFSNMIFIVISQFENFGTLIHVTSDAVLGESSGVPTFTTKTLLGEEEEILNAVARNLASRVITSKPILFALALQHKTPSAMKEVAELMLKCKCW